MNQWVQNYNPISNVWLSTAVAAIPVVVLFYLLAVRKTHAHRAAIYGFLASVLIAVLEGSGGGGAPVAVAGAMMVGLGFNPFGAAVLCLIANTAPVAFGGVGNPIRALVAVTGLPDADLSAMVGRILPWTALILPFWLIRSMAGWRQTFSVWPAALLCGGVFA